MRPLRLTLEDGCQVGECGYQRAAQLLNIGHHPGQPQELRRLLCLQVLIFSAARSPAGPEYVGTRTSDPHCPDQGICRAKGRGETFDLGAQGSPQFLVVIVRGRGGLTRAPRPKPGRVDRWRLPGAVSHPPPAALAKPASIRAPSGMGACHFRPIVQWVECGALLNTVQAGRDDSDLPVGLPDPTYECGTKLSDTKKSPRSPLGCT